MFAAAGWYGDTLELAAGDYKCDGGANAYTRDTTQYSAGLHISKPIVIKGVKAGTDARGRSVIGLGNNAYDNVADGQDAAESNIYNKVARDTTISIQASDVTLDGLTITGDKDKNLVNVIDIFANTGETFARIKITNCVIRHVVTSGKLHAINFQFKGTLSDIELSNNEIRDFGKSSSADVHAIYLGNTGTFNTPNQIKNSYLQVIKVKNTAYIKATGS